MVFQYGGIKIGFSIAINISDEVISIQNDHGGGRGFCQMVRFHPWLLYTERCIYCVLFAYAQNGLSA